MPFILSRADDRLIQYLPVYSLGGGSVEMKGKYTIDFPDGFDMTRDLVNLDVSNPATTKSTLLSLVASKYQGSFNYDVYDSNYLEDAAAFNSTFDVAASFPSVDAGAFLTPCYKMGDTPQTLSIRGRWPQEHTTEGWTLVEDLADARNHCLVTQEIDITATTPDGQGRSEFLLFFKDCIKEYTKDRTDLSGTGADVSSRDRAGNLHYRTRPSNFLRSYISSDGGATFTEITNLQRFSFSSSQGSIRLAFVNPTNVDVHLLSYTLMY